jgi:hypothetical protein
LVLGRFVRSLPFDLRKIGALGLKMPPSLTPLLLATRSYLMMLGVHWTFSKKNTVFKEFLENFGSVIFLMKMLLSGF